MGHICSIAVMLIFLAAAAGLIVWANTKKP